MADNHAQDDSSGPQRIEFHLIKSNYFRVIHIDGGIGGLTPNGYCHFALYNERGAIPRTRVRDILSDNEASEERTVEVLGEPNIGIVREIEVDLIFDQKTARSIHAWLGRRIEEFEQAEQLQSVESDRDTKDDQS